jgi:hypothetical protein
LNVPSVIPLRHDRPLGEPLASGFVLLRASGFAQHGLRAIHRLSEALARDANFGWSSPCSVAELGPPQAERRNRRLPLVDHRIPSGTASSVSDRQHRGDRARRLAILAATTQIPPMRRRA